MPTIGFPLLLIPIAIYNIVVFLMPGVVFTAPVVTLHLLSGAAWPISMGDILVALGIFLMLFEFARASRPGAKYAMDHLLSLAVLGGAGAEFLWLAPFGTSTFCLLVILTAVDFFGGLTLAVRHRKAVRAARRQDAYRETDKSEQERPIEPVSTAPSQPQPVEPGLTHPHMEVVTPVVDSAPEPVAPQIETPKAVSVDQIPDPEPPPRKPVRAISEWNVADLVRDTEAAPAKPAAAGPETESTARSPVVPLRD
jgi:hypothetical protein